MGLIWKENIKDWLFHSYCWSSYSFARQEIWTISRVWKKLLVSCLLQIDCDPWMIRVWWLLVLILRKQFKVENTKILMHKNCMGSWFSSRMHLRNLWVLLIFWSSWKKHPFYPNAIIAFRILLTIPVTCICGTKLFQTQVIEILLTFYYDTRKTQWIGTNSTWKWCLWED